MSLTSCFDDILFEEELKANNEALAKEVDIVEVEDNH